MTSDAWPAWPVGYLYSVRDERWGSDGGARLLAVSQHQGVVPRSEITDKGERADSLSNYKICSPNDIVINRMSAYQGALGISAYHGVVSPDYLVVRPHRNVEPRFLAHLFKSAWFVGQMTARIRGIGSVEQGNVRTPRINEEDLSRIGVALPPISTQRAVADYLDRETARIDALIVAKQQLLEVLLERRRTLVTSWVTSGLQDDADISDSQLLAFGNVPHTWTVFKFSRIAEVAEGQVDPKDSRFAEQLLIAPNHIESETGRLTARETASQQGAISGKYVCHGGDVVYSKIRPALQKATIAPEDCLCSADMYPLRPLPHVVRADYLLLLVLSVPFTRWAVLESDRVAMPKINRDALADLRMPLPPLEEQRRIVQGATAATTLIDSQRDAIQRSVSLLRERRQTLITAAVTGELDIPEVPA